MVERTECTDQAALSNIEVSMTSCVNPVNQGVKMTKLQAKGDDTLAILHQENVWICDMGTRTYLLWSNTHARNVEE